MVSKNVKNKRLVWAPLSSDKFTQRVEESISLAIKNVNKSDKFKLQEHQKIVRAYMNPETPYRGILLYHGLGSGKTCSAIAISEGFKNERKTVVFLPGESLEDNFKHELELCGGQEYSTSHRNWKFHPSTFENEERMLSEIPAQAIDEFGGGWFIEEGRGNFSKLDKVSQKQIKKQIEYKIKDHYDIVRYNGVSPEKLDGFKRSGFLDNKLIIVDEAHNIISMMTNYINNPNDKKSHMRGRALYELLMSAQNAKIIFLTGTPIMNYPKEISVLFNVLRGPVAMFKYVVETSKPEEIEATLRKFKYLDFLRITHGNKVELTQTVFGFAIQDGEILRDENAPKNHVEWIEKFKSFTKSHNMSIDDGDATEHNCFPTDDTFESSFLNDSTTDIRNKEVLMRRIIGLVSFYGDASEDVGKLQDDGSKVYIKPNFPKMTIHPVQKVDMSEVQFEQYAVERMKEMKSDASKAQRKPRFGDESKDTSTYRARSLALSTFVFPQAIDPDEVKITAENRDKVMVQLKNKFEAYVNSLNDAEVDDKLSKLSPKYWEIKERIEKLSGTAAVYSRLKNREGLLSMFVMLERCGWKPLRINENKKTKQWTCTHGGNKTYVLYGDKEDENRERLRKIFNGDIDGLPQGLKDVLPSLDNKNGGIIKAFFITASGAEGITLKNVRQMHIIEHHWSPVRIDQVIGRVNRLHSHATLPESDRTVDIYKYSTRFGSELISKLKKNDFTKDVWAKIDIKDNGLTSDEHQLEVSERKRFINNKLLACLRSASIDCALHKVPGCYQIDNNSYEPSFEDHLKNSTINTAPEIELESFEVPTKTWIPKKFHGKKMAINKLTNEVYDLESVKVGRPVVKAIYLKDQKKFVVQRKK